MFFSFIFGSLVEILAQGRGEGVLGPPFIRNRRKRQFQRHPAQNRHFFGQSGLLARRQRHTARDPLAAKLLAGIVDRGGDVEMIGVQPAPRSEEPTSELQTLIRIAYTVLCLNKKKNKKN